MNQRLDDRDLEYLSNTYQSGNVFSGLIDELLEVTNINTRERERDRVLKFIRFYAITGGIVDTIKSGGSVTYDAQTHQIYVNLSSRGQTPIKYDLDLYKIHLMPRDDILEPFWSALVTLLLTHPILRADVDASKILIVPSSELEGAPRIVLYTSQGKYVAQRVLNVIYGIYGQLSNHSNGLIPDYNEKITDLIYVAQGNRDEKIEYLIDHVQPVMEKVCQQNESGYIIDQKCIDNVIQMVQHTTHIPVIYQLPEMIYYSHQYGEHILKHRLPKDYFSINYPT
jgi:hypothetical protein